LTMRATLFSIVLVALFFVDLSVSQVSFSFNDC
jgi:hypothetical protein